MSVQAEYRDAVYSALERCQFIEETLRVYLDIAIQIAKIKLEAYYPVNIDKKDLSKLSLGKLVDKFSKFNGNASLVSDLRNVTPDRNKIAHNSLLFTIGEIQDNIYLKNQIHEMNEIERRAKDIHGTLLDERWALQRSLSNLQRQRKQNENDKN